MRIFEVILNAIIPLSKKRSVAENISTDDFIKLIKLVRVNGHLSLLSYKEEAVKTVIQSFKYEKSWRSAKLLTKALVEILFELFAEATMKYSRKKIFITFVPSGKVRLKEFGYHHLNMIARILEKEVGIKCVELLFRNRETKRQVGLTKKERLENVKGAFEILDENVLDKDSFVIIFDDIVTTGATLNECKKALLKKAGGVETIAISHKNY